MLSSALKNKLGGKMMRGQKESTFCKATMSVVFALYGGGKNET